MKIRVIVVGRVKKDYYKKALSDYLKRINRYVKCEITEVKEGFGPRAREVEAERMLQLKSDGLAVAVDKSGVALSSKELAQLIEKQEISGTKRIDFFVGGPDGFGEAFLKEADLKVSLSTLTLQHDLATLVLLEQIYRVYKINRGEPYHR
jgi:23S rRNA (pseudouridine1915-N3)-methyltransferase